MGLCVYLPKGVRFSIVRVVLILPTKKYNNVAENGKKNERCFKYSLWLVNFGVVMVEH